MYLEFFNLKDHPFRLTPDAEFLFLSEQHTRGKAAMEQAFRQRDALVVVTGEVGCGKSILVNRVAAELAPEAAVARLTLTNLDSQEFLQSVLSQYGFQPFERDHDKLMGLLNNFLFAQNVRERPVVLIIEEAQNLSRQVLNIVRELADLEEGSEKLISIILVGQPNLNDRLKEKDLSSVADRVTCSAHLEPLDQRDTARLIHHRLQAAGCIESPFEPEVLAQIYSYTNGIPRVIINLCDTAMTAAYVEDSRQVTPEILGSAIEELELEKVAESDPNLSLADDSADQERAVSITMTERGQPVGEFPLTDTRVMIGRDSDNDITIVSEYISRHHAQIVMDHEGRFWIKDLNSTNGMFVNRQKTQRSLLNNGDRIVMGFHELTFHDTGATATSSSPSQLGEWRDTTVFGEETDEDQADSA